MAIQFPNSPGIGSVFTDTDAGFSYEWTGVVWKSFTPAAANNIKELDDISSGFDNSTTTFNLTIGGTAYQPRNAAMLQISLGGVIQEPSTDYTVDGSTITFTTAPNAGLDFFGVVRGTAVAIDYANDGNVQTKQEFTATEGQTSFTITGGYTAGYIDVFRNGVRLAADDITISSGTAVVLATPAQAGDIIETVKYNVASIVTTAGQFQNLNITGVTTVGVVTGATSIQSGVYYGDGSALTGIDVTSLKDSGGNVKAQANPGGVVITGVTTATTFVGNLTGNVTGNTSGTAGGLTGTPNITVGSVTASSGSFSGNVSIGGTLSYQDVTNIDAVGIITAQEGIQVLANGLDITGFSTFKTGVSVTGVVTATSFSGDVNAATFDTGVGGVVVTGVATATTFKGELTGAAVTTSSAGLQATNVDFAGLLREQVFVTDGKLSDNTNIDLENGMVHLFTTAETTTATPNLRVDSSTSLNSTMAIGEAISVTIVTTAAAAGYAATVNIDGATVGTNGGTLNWTGGSAPSDGGSSGVDIYAYTIMKTASATYTVIASQTKTS